MEAGGIAVCCLYFGDGFEISTHTQRGKPPWGLGNILEKHSFRTAVPLARYGFVDEDWLQIRQECVREARVCMCVRVWLSESVWTRDRDRGG